MIDEHYVVWENRTYRDQWVSLDNARFVNCTFERVTFVYSGGPWKIEACHFLQGVTIALQGSALWTASLLEECRARLKDFQIWRGPDSTMTQ